MDMTVDSLLIEVQAPTAAAEKGIDNLSDSLSKLGKATRGLGLSGVAKQFKSVGTALNAMDAASISKLDTLSNALGKLSAAGNVKISSSIANQITNLGTATKSLDGADFSKLADLANAISPLTTIGKTNLGSTVSQLSKLPAAVQPLSTMDMGGLNQKLRELVEAVKPLAEMRKANLSSTLNQIKKLPEAFATLNALDLTSFAKKIREVAAAMSPLANEMQKVADGFSAFPAKIQKLLNATNQIPKANARAGASYVDLAAKIAIAYTAIRQTVRTIGSWIGKSNDYIESINLFNVSMGSYADEAYKYAQTVGDAMGIDPAEWMENQGIFMNLATGFGVVNDRAYTMSKNLTQLGYDLSSFFNLSYAEAMQKLQSGMAGEIEPLRRLGYDLSQARLEAVALSLGIDKAVASMTQAEKAELRYYAIMTMATNAQGDMARTLNAPANQLRVLKAQVTQAARALGNIFIPALNAVLPFAIAVAKVVQYVANAIASLFGFEISPVDWSGLGEVSGGAADASDALDDATGSAKALKKTLLGIDELNLLTDNSNSGGGGADIGGGGGGFDFELPTYDFIDELTESRVAQIVKDMKEWLGLTEEINSWADLLDTRFGTILKTVGLIGAGIAAWKIGGMIATAFNAVSSAVGSLASAWTGVQTAITAASTALGVSVGTIAAVVAVVAALVAGLTAVYLTNENVRASVDHAIASIGGALVPLFEFVTGTVLPDLKSAWDELLSILEPLGDWVESVFTSIWEDMLTPALEWIASDAIPSVTECFQNLWNNVLVPFGSFVGSVLTPVITVLTDVLTWLWKYVVVPIADFIGGVFATAWENLVKIYNEVVIPKLNQVISVFQFLWNNVLSPVVKFLWDVFAPGFEEVFKSVGSVITSLKNAFSGLINFVTGVFTGDWEQAWSGVTQLFGSIFSGIGTLLKTPLNAALATIESFINKIINGWNWLKKQINKLSITIPDWLGGGTLGFNLQMSSHVSLPRFADGGFPNVGQMFVAREAGPELVGTIGNRTAVVNNDQIVASVSQGVYEANSEQNALLREQNNLLRKLLEKDTNVTAVVGTGDVISGFERKNRRDGRTVVPVGY